MSEARAIKAIESALTGWDRTDIPFHLLRGRILELFKREIEIKPLHKTHFDLLTLNSLSNITARVLCDSINPDVVRLTTMEWKYPRFIHAEIMTHRQLSRNSASSRAIPMKKMIQNVTENPVFKIEWGKNQKGMQASQEELTMDEKLLAGARWLAARDDAVEHALALEQIGVHKQVGNRLLEDWMWITVIVSATNLENLFALRVSPLAEPHFQNLAGKILSAYDNSTPQQLQWGDWHLPLVTGYEKFTKSGHDVYDFEDQKDWHTTSRGLAEISAGRCARVSYLTHEGKRDMSLDLDLCYKLASSKPMHASPLEHPAQAVNPNMHIGTRNSERKDWGNYAPGWLQLRKMYENEVVRTRKEWKS